MGDRLPRRSRRIEEKSKLPSPTDFAAGKFHTGIQGESPAMEASSSKVIEEKSVRFGSKKDVRAITPFVSRDVEMEDENNISIMERHRSIFKESYKQAKEIYNVLTREMFKKDIVDHTGIKKEDLDRFMNTFNRLKGVKEISSEKLDMFVETTEEVIDAEIKLKEFARKHNISYKKLSSS